MSLIDKLGLRKDRTGASIVDGVAEGFEAFALAALSAEAAPDGPVIFVARDGQRLPALGEALAFAAPGLPVLELPAWDCLPYDRVSPGADTVARRVEALAAMAALEKTPHRSVVLTTANALMQRLPPRAFAEAQTFRARTGNQVDMNALIARLENSGFDRVATVREVGEFAVRGGILDLFAPGGTEALRLDFFGDTLDSIRCFDVATQRTTGQRTEVTLQAMSEVALTPETISRFRRNYIEAFGAPNRDDALYAAVSEGRRFAGMEHWLPFFYGGLETLFDYLPAAPIAFDHLAREAMDERHALIEDYYQARRQQAGSALKNTVPYQPVPPALMYLSPDEVAAALPDRLSVEFTPFATPEAGARKVLHAGSRQGRGFELERADPSANVFQAAVDHIASLRANKRKVVVAGWTEGSRDRLAQILTEHGLGSFKPVSTLDDAERLAAGQVGLAVLPLESGFETDRFAVIAEQDILGDRLVRRTRRRRAADFIAEASSLSAGDIVVHAQHGIGRFAGLKTIEALGAPHDCLEIHYAGDDRLFLPVENIELLSRFGSDAAETPLDKLGGGAWQARKAKLKRRLLDMAGQLIRLAAERQMRGAPAFNPPPGVYGEFAARFPYEETDDQQRAIDSVMDDLAAGKPMDRLICGDVGFGKTEVALRAAFLAAMEGFQVAVVVPTTLAVAPAFQDLHPALFRPAAGHSPGLAHGTGKGTRRDQEGCRGRNRRHRHRHACAAGVLDLVQAPGSAGHRRGAAFRREAQGAAQGAQDGRACADAVGDADPAYAATGAYRRARAFAHRHATGRPARRADLHFALRSAGDSRDAAARALSRRPVLLCRAAHLRSRRGPGVPPHAGAGAEGGRPRTARCRRANWTTS